MARLIIYDSAYGNTEQVARALGEELGAVALRVGDADVASMGELSLFIVGSPTQGGRPTAAVQTFLQRLPDGALKGVPVAAFDTRLEKATRGFFLKLLMSVIGYAAPKIAAQLRKQGATLIADAEGFLVTDKEGPLKSGELDRARAWAADLATRISAGR